jgi:putative selenate reductase molybdopterin-binding subunit
MGMDINSITSIVVPNRNGELPPWRSGDAWLAGGTWLYSEPQPDLRRFIDLTAFGWEAVRRKGRDLEIAATCTIAELADYASNRASVHVFAERVGGGFGGKQEMLVEDIVALAVVTTGRPVKLELSRQEQFATTTSRHPIRMRVRAGARADGKLTALALDVLSDTGAYGNHAAGTLFHACNESIAVYRCPNKKVDGVVVYTHTVPSGALRGYGLSQTNFAVESAMDDLARQLGIDPFAFRRLNMIRPGDKLVSNGHEPDDVDFGSYGLDQCLDLVEAALGCRTDAPPADGEWTVGTGMALGMLDTIPPRGHRAEARLRLAADGAYELAVGTAEFGNGTTTVHRQIAAATLGTTTERIRIAQPDTDIVDHDTGAYGSTGTVVAGMATRRAAQQFALHIIALAARKCSLDPATSRLGETGLVEQDRRYLTGHIHPTDADFHRLGARFGSKSKKRQSREDSEARAGQRVQPHRRFLR